MFHGAAELYLDARWLKTTPAFNASLCKYLGVAPLEFDGLNDSIFQQYDGQGNVFMTYLHDYGAFPDMPYQLYLRELRAHYGRAGQQPLRHTGAGVRLQPPVGSPPAAHLARQRTRPASGWPTGGLR